MRTKSFVRTIFSKLLLATDDRECEICQSLIADKVSFGQCQEYFLFVKQNALA